METCLDGSSISVLWVIDNGIGLSPEHMTHLLGDGQSAKRDASSTGAFGNGHITVFPASDLRYLLYGGVYNERETTKRIFCGHTILASRQDASSTKALGKDGYLLQSLNNDDLFDRFVYCDETIEAPLIHDKLDQIEHEFGTGSCVGILGFNHFYQEGNLGNTIETIERVSAVHFLPLIFNERLEISIFEKDQKKSVVNRENIHEILYRYKDERRRRKKTIGPSGNQSWATLDAHERGERLTLSTSLGNVDTLVLNGSESQAQNTNIQLFRNGMWITNKVPKNEIHRFQSRLPFTAVLLLDSWSANEACELLRDCEGPRHIDLLPQRLANNKKGKKKFNKFFDEIYEQLQKITPEKSTEIFDPGFLLISATGLGKGKNRTPIVDTDPDGPEGENGGGTGDGSGGTRLLHRLTKPFECKSSAVFDQDKLIVTLQPQEDARRVALRLKIADGVDSTCDAPLKPTFLAFGKVELLDNKLTELRDLEKVIKSPNGDESRNEDRFVAFEFGPAKTDVQLRFRILMHGNKQLKVDPVIYRCRANRTK